MDSYSERGYGRINATLRSGEGKLPKASGVQVVPVLDRMMKPMPEDVKELYRGVSKLPCEMKVGATFQEKAYSSTSDSKVIAEKFAKGTGIVMKIENPHNTTAIDNRKGRYNESEREVLLARGCKFRITKIESEGKRSVVTVKIIE